MKVMSPGPASATRRAEWIGTVPSPTRRPRTRAASCSTVATTGDFLSSLKGADMDRVFRILEPTPVQTGLESIAIALASHRRAFLAGAECNPSRQVRQEESSPSKNPSLARLFARLLREWIPGHLHRQSGPGNFRLPPTETREGSSGLARAETVRDDSHLDPAAPRKVRREWRRGRRFRGRRLRREPAGRAGSGAHTPPEKRPDAACGSRLLT